MASGNSNLFHYSRRRLFIVYRAFIFIVAISLLLFVNHRALVRADETTPPEEIVEQSQTPPEEANLPSEDPLENSSSLMTSTSTEPLDLLIDTSSLPLLNASSTEEVLPEELPTSTEDLSMDTSSLALLSTSSTEEVAPGSGTLIGTGDAMGTANIVNVINTNIFDSQGLLSLLNLLFPTTGDVDLQNFSFGESPCNSSDCWTSLSSENNNDADVINDVLVVANSGSNEITGSGTSTIVTGSSVASANVVNVVNTNIVSSNYLLLVLNNFNSWIGDLVFPGKGFFTDNPSSGSAGGNDTTITNNNSSTVSNNVNVSADTGSNEIIDGSGSSTIVTGEAVAVANDLTVANTNIVGNQQVIIVIRVFGNWTGNVFSTPPGISWQETPQGVILYNDSLGGGCCGLPGSVSNSNDANVQNNLNVMALTGNNKIQGGGNSFIGTGDAVAVGNTMNLINTNIVGQNILLAMINIFGDWQGDLAFGRPDIWLGLQADLPANPVPVGGETVYHLTVFNRGNADATKVKVRAKATLDNFTRFSDVGGGSVDENGAFWTIPYLAAGASTTLTFKEVLTDSVFGRQSLAVSASSFEDDADKADNTDSISFPIEGGKGLGEDMSPLLWIKEANAVTTPIEPDSLVDYKILVGNDGAVEVDEVSVLNMLYSPYGDIVSSSSWNLGTVNPGKQFRISYSTKYMPNASSGYYISYSWLKSKNRMSNGIESNFIASSSVYLINPADMTVAVPPAPYFFVPPADLEIPENKTSTVGTITLASAQKKPAKTIARAPRPKPPLSTLLPSSTQPSDLIAKSVPKGVPSPLTTIVTKKIDLPTTLASVALTKAFGWLYGSILSPAGQNLGGLLGK